MPQISVRKNATLTPIHASLPAAFSSAGMRMTWFFNPVAVVNNNTICNAEILLFDFKYNHQYPPIYSYLIMVFEELAYTSGICWVYLIENVCIKSP